MPKCQCKAKLATFRTFDDVKPRYCRLCKPENAFCVPRRCRCGKHVPIYLLPHQGQCVYCKECAPLGAVCKTFKRYLCECGKHASFRDPETNQKKWCAQHRPQGAKLARTCVCGSTIPMYKLQGETTKYCKKCKPADAVYSYSKVCECGKTKPCYGHSLDEIKWCHVCKEPGMHRLVGVCECGASQPSFQSPTSNALRWCAKCKPSNAISKSAQRKSRAGSGSDNDSAASEVLAGDVD